MVGDDDFLDEIVGLHSEKSSSGPYFSVYSSICLFSASPPYGWDVCWRLGAAASEGLGEGFGLGFEWREGRATDGRGKEEGLRTGFCSCG